MSTVHHVPGVVVTDREHVVPLDHARPDGPTITVFTRELVGEGGEDHPYLVFLQGGPGFEAPRPAAPPKGWVVRALREYRVLMLDQRGTGRSTPVGRTIPGATAEAQADHLAHFRADAIVRDAELIRRELGVERWTVLGQSFGGFCSLHYLSFFPDGLLEVLNTGGVAAVGPRVDEVYASTYVKTAARNRAYFARYPGDRTRLREAERRIENEEIRLPSGDRLTVRRFRQIGMMLGMGDGFELLHHLLELPVDSAGFAADAEHALGFSRNPLYATLHESSYADGVRTAWSAARLYPDEFAEEGWLTAEHIFPWMWEDYGALHGHREAAELLAQRDWPRMYDAAQLAVNRVPVAGTIYVDDIYVPLEQGMETAALVRGMRPWITNEYQHDGLRADGERVLGRLIDLVKGRA